MYSIGIFSWSQFTLPSGFDTGMLTSDTTPSGWIGETFAFNGGAPADITISDNDADFEDGYVETGGAQTLSEAVTIDGVTYPAGSVVENEFSLTDAGGMEIHVVRIDGENVGFTYKAGDEPIAGDTFTAQSGLDGAPSDNPDGASSSTTTFEEVTGDYSVQGYALGDITAVSGGTGPAVRLDTFFDAQDAAYTFDFQVGESGNPPTVDVLDETGTPVTSGEVTFRFEITVTAPDGDTIKIYDVSTDGAVRGWVATDELQPGVAYSYSVNVINASGSDAEAILENLNSASYDQDADNTIAGGGNNDQLWGDDSADSIDGAAGNDTIGGGVGDDTLTGGAGDDSFFITDGAGNDTITDFDLSDDDGDGSSNDRLNVSMLSDADGNPIGLNDVTVSDDGSGNAVLSFPNGETVTLIGVTPAQVTSQQMVGMGIPCFTVGTSILTPNGAKPVEALGVGDLVITRDHGARPIRYIASREVIGPAIPEGQLPILISAGSLGSGLPGRDLVVSGQHRILLSGSFVRQMHGTQDVLAPAKGLVPLTGIRVKRGVRKVVYIHLLFDKHEIIFAENAPTASYYPGPTVLRDMGRKRREDLFRAMPELRLGVEIALGKPARKLLSVQQTRRLANNLKKLMSAEVTRTGEDLFEERPILEITTPDCKAFAV